MYEYCRDIGPPRIIACTLLDQRSSECPWNADDSPKFLCHRLWHSITHDAETCKQIPTGNVLDKNPAHVSRYGTLQLKIAFKYTVETKLSCSLLLLLQLLLLTTSSCISTSWFKNALDFSLSHIFEFSFQFNSMHASKPSLFVRRPGFAIQFHPSNPFPQVPFPQITHPLAPLVHEGVDNAAYDPEWRADSWIDGILGRVFVTLEMGEMRTILTRLC